MFVPSRLTLARKRRGMTKIRLGETTSLTVRSITAYESGDYEPTSAHLTTLSNALQFPEDFFSQPEVSELPPNGASFRAMSSMTAYQRDMALSAGYLAVELNQWLEDKFNLPQSDVPSLRNTEPEAAAEYVRNKWTLGELTIRNMIHLLELHGVRIYSLAESCREVDAFSLWRGNTPFIFLNTTKSAERSRFDCAHELGHLVLHRHGAPNGREAEQQADTFASAMLMPKGSVLAKAPRMATLDLLIALKKHWTVSVGALAYRLRALNLLTEWQYRTICVQIAQLGYRTREPQGSSHETSQILNKVFLTLREENIAKKDVARDLRIDPTDLDALLFGLVMVPVAGNGQSGASSKKRRPDLKIV
ncbi:ImmA/IrrE family metallo-endopeptidase [bacterium]|nr:ImmA/IrrE family metallo-endopeptidase [bacterium]